MKKKYLLLTTLAFFIIASTAIAQDIPSFVPSDGLIGWWPFNGNVNDESGNNNNGINNGASLTTDRFGKADKAYLFDGTSSYMSVPSSASLESPTVGLTMSAWVNLSGVSLVGQPFAPVITKTNSVYNGFMYRLDVDVNAKGFYAGINNWDTNVGASYNFKLNQWYMISAVLDSFTTYIYLDDTLVNTLPLTTKITLNTLPLEFGRDMPGDREIFNGKIDDIGIWKRALSQKEITTMYSSVTTGISEGVIETSVNIYPNPATDQITVKANESIVGSPYIVTDILGRTIMSGKLDSANTIIPVSNLPIGIYTLSIRDNMKQRFKIVKN